MLATTRGFSVLCATVLVSGCLRFEPLAGEGPVPEAVAVEDASGPEWIDRGVIEIPNGLGAIYSEIGVVDGRLLCLSHSDSNSGPLPFAVWLRPSRNSLEVEQAEQLLDRSTYNIQVVPGSPPTIFFGRLHSFEPAPRLFSKEFRLVEIPAATTEVAAAGSFVAYDTWFLISAMGPCGIEGQTVHLARFDGQRFDVLESNDYNSSGVSFRMAGDDRRAAVLIERYHEIQLLRHDPENGESTIRLCSGDCSSGVVRLRGSTLFCAWLESIHDSRFLVYDGNRTSRIESGTTICEIDPLLLEDGSALVLLRHREGKTGCFVWRDPEGRWFRGRPFPIEKQPTSAFEAFGSVWGLSVVDGQQRIWELRR